MLGRQILAAPVLEKTDKWDVYLPEGKWVYYWTGREFTGPQTVTVDAPLYGRDGLPMFVKAGAIIPMMPEMSYIYEKAPDPLTLDVYPDSAGPSTYVMYDCERPEKSPMKETAFKCVEDERKIEISISPSSVAYELWVHYDKSPTSVVADSKALAKIEDRCGYGKAKEGWYYGPGCFYGSEGIRTVNIKIPKISKRRLIQVLK